MISTFASHAILNYLLGRVNFTRPVHYKLDLSTAPLGANGIGLVKPADPAYRTLSIANTKANFSHAANRKVELISENIFPESTVDWLPIVNYVISDDADNVWFYGAISNASPVRIQIESSAIIDANINSFMLDVCGGSTSDMAITTEKANMILDYIFGGMPFTPPQNYYLGVSLTPISADGIGKSEPFAPGYARLQLPNDKNTFTNADNFTITLAKQFKFVSALTEWGNLTHFFISDSPSGENIWWSGKMTYDRFVEIATTLVLNPDGFSWVLANCE